jgi:transposase
MPRKTGLSRLQYGLFATPLEDMIAPDNTVRVVDAFVDSLDLEKLGFRAVRPQARGASSFAPDTLLKIYFYGYLNRVRSSRRLQAECRRNVELMWLTERQTPSYHTISTFRTLQEKDAADKIVFCHRKALKNVFKAFNLFLDRMEMFGKETVAIDGTKIAAQNSKKNHLTEDKIARKLERIENRIDEYLDELDAFDAKEIEEETPDVKAVLLAIADLDERKERLMDMDDLLLAAKAEDPYVTQISLTDPEARMLPLNNEGMMELAYNVQSAVDDKHSLIAHYSVENQKDVYLLSPVAIETKKALGLGKDDSLNALADKGYHSGKGLHECTEEGIVTYVAFPEQSHKDRPKGFQKADFKYNKEKDQYTCPAGKSLKTRGTWHEKHGRNGQVQYRYKLYRSSFSTCLACPFAHKCLSEANLKQSHGRSIERSEYEEAAIANRKRILLQRDMYKRRQAIVEHPFGTIKRSWGFNYTLLKSKEKVSGEMAIIFTAYNLRRSMSILGVSALIEALKERFWDFFDLRAARERPVAVLSPVAVGRLSARLAQVRRRA